METKTRGRKVNVENKNLINEVFFASEDVNEFVIKCNLKESTARVYWYRLCKENDRKVEQKRGRKSSKIDYEKKYNVLLEAIKQEYEVAKNSKKSTVIFKRLLDL